MLKLILRLNSFLFILILWFGIHQIPGVSQSLDISFKHLTVENGLSNNWVKSIIRDQDGFMWFGTFNGLNRYDGDDIKIFQSSDEYLLSDNFITALAEDKNGFIWVGTFSGGLNLLNKDTETFTTFIHDPSDTKSIISNRIYSIFTDHNGDLWIGTSNGLELFDYATKTFIHFQHSPLEQKSISDNYITCVFQDNEQRLWIGTQDGLNLYQPKSKDFIHYKHDPNKSTSLGHNHITSIYQDKYGFLWIGTWGGGIDKFDPNKEFFQHFKSAPGQQGGINNNTVLSITGDNENHLFVATEGGGLNILDLQKETFKNYPPDFTDPRSINSNSIHALYYDHDNGMLWVGSYNGGLNFFGKWDKPFKHYYAEIGGLNNNHITCVAEEKNGNLWIGTDGGGINIINNHSGSFSYITSDIDAKNTIQNNAILSLLIDSKGNKWVGTYNGGLDLISGNSNSVKNFFHDPLNESSLSGKNVSSIYEDKRGNIWIGTMNGGLNLFDPVSETFLHFKNTPLDSNSIIDNFIYGIFEDRLGRLLVQTGKGLEIFDYGSQHFERYNKDLETDFDVPITMLEDTQGNLWIGSRERGIFRIDRTGIKVNNYTIKDGLPSNSISGILEDESGNLWISTHKGLCQFEEAVSVPEKVKIHTYTVEDGLQGSEFKNGAYCKRNNGEMVFGGQNGINIFNPIKIKNNPFIPPVKITGFKLFNKNVDFKENEILEKPISRSQSITLDYKESVFTIEFSALNFMLPQKNQYAFMMEGFEDTWNYVGNQNNATYTNLDPGTYTFKVKASNNDGIWNENGTQIKITILPPWWANWYFRGISIVIFIGGIFSYYKIRTFQLKQSKKELEKQVALRTADLEKATAVSEERQLEILRQNETLLNKNKELKKQSTEIKRMAEEIKELNDAKLRFFTNISHELRTPLNLILWPLEEIMDNQDKLPAPLKNKYDLMHLNARKLIKLINQLLDFRKVETGSLKANFTKKDIIGSVKKTYGSFIEWARKNDINYKFKSNLNSWEVLFDEDKLDKILSNLLSNSFKFTDSGGKISLIIQSISSENNGSHDTPRIRIEVKDNGKGMSAEQLEHIFERFYEGKANKFPGSGIGLSLVKELVNLQEGKLWVRSEKNSGTSFFIELPVYDSIPEQKNTGSADVYEALKHDQTENSVLPSVTDSEAGHKIPSVLIIEDNTDILNFMEQKLKKYYHTDTAVNAKSGIRKALSSSPDIIISDVMMPEMDGFEMCEVLKMDKRTSHIPIILVTARTGMENEIKGLTFGADDYISKPFPFKLLLLKIKNILYTRQNLKEQFLKSTLIYPEQLNISSVDDQFLQMATKAVKENIENVDFGVEKFCKYFQMSRRHVLRKMKSITGLSINEYIRVIRLKESYHLLSSGNMNISEVAYAVGFSDPKYFSNCFKKHFGHTPSKLKSE